MANCPACDHEAKEEFGMVTCEACRQVFMIDFEGKVSVAEDHEEPSSVFIDDDTLASGVESQEGDPIEGNNEPSQLFSVDNMPSEVDCDEDEVPNENSVVLDFPGDQDSETDAELTSESEPAFEPGSDFEEVMDYESADGIESEPGDNEYKFETGDQSALDHDSTSEEEDHMLSNSEGENQILSDLSEDEESGNTVEEENEFSEATQAVEMNEIPATPAEVDPEDPLEVSAFAASELSGLEGGLLLYDVTIDGIDTPELRQILMFNIEDERFAWDATRVLRNISNGCLLIENLNPLKAHVLINSLRFEDFIVSWQQKIVTDMPLPSEDEDYDGASEDYHEEPSDFDDEDQEDYE